MKIYNNDVFGRERNNIFCKIILIIIFISILLIGFIRIELQRTVVRNTWFAELQETKRVSIIAKRECGDKVWQAIQDQRLKNHR